MHRNSRGVADFPTACALTSSEIFSFYLHACVFTYFTYVCVKVCKCPDDEGHSERALLLPRVYLQTVTLMQCNDYFYSGYFGSPFALSGMTPHWPTDYLCGCCHTWLLQLSSLSTTAPSEPLPFYYCTFICSFLYTSSSFNSELQLYSLQSRSLL